MSVDWLSQDEVDSLLKGVTGESNEFWVAAQTQIAGQTWYFIKAGDQTLYDQMSAVVDPNAVLRSLSAIMVDEQMLTFLRLQFNEYNN